MHTTMPNKINPTNCHRQPLRRNIFTSPSSLPCLNNPTHSKNSILIVAKTIIFTSATILLCLATAAIYSYTTSMHASSSSSSSQSLRVGIDETYLRYPIPAIFFASAAAAEANPHRRHVVKRNLLGGEQLSFDEIGGTREEGEAVGDDEEEEKSCFDQQYSNHLADLGSLHTIRKVAVIAPLGAYYLDVGVDSEDEGPPPPSSSAFYDAAGGRRRSGISSGGSSGEDGWGRLVRRESGDAIAIYSSSTSAHLEWQQMGNLLASRLRIRSAFADFGGEGQPGEQQEVSPVLMLTACPYRQRAIHLDNQPFQVDSSRVGLVAMYENELVVDFRTYEANGIFFFSMADTGDMLVLQLAGGRLEAHYDFGSQSRSVMSGGRALNDGSWHEARWSHQFDSVQLRVDGVLMNSSVPAGLYRKLDFNHQVEVGGRPEDPYSSELHTTYYGCLARVELNNINLLEAAPRATRDCRMPHPQVLTLLDTSRKLLIPYSFLPFTLEFRIIPSAAIAAATPTTATAKATGTSLLAILDTNNATLLELLIDGATQSLVLEAEQRQIRQKAQELPFHNAGYADGSWHSLSIRLRAGRLDIDIDGTTALWLEGQLVRLIGLKMTTFVLAAAGCYRSTTVDLRSAASMLTAAAAASSINDETTENQFFAAGSGGGGVVRDRCAYVEQCVPEPCQNGGRCVQDGLDTFHCVCPTHYTGTFCHTSALPRSCEDYRAGGGQRQAQQQQNQHPLKQRQARQKKTAVTSLLPALEQNITIDLDGGGPLRPFQVQCRWGAGSTADGLFARAKALTSRGGGGRGGSATTQPKSISGEEEEGDSSAAARGDAEEDELGDDGEGENDLVTILTNDSPAEGIFVEGATEPGAIRRPIDYGIDGVELDRLIDGFEQCRQHMRFECRGGTRLMTYGQERRPSTWYATRNGQHGLQWGAAPPYSRMCTCGVNASCDYNRACNCDSGRDGVDAGWNIHHQLLPVLQLYIGGTGHRSSANISIGPMRCVGKYAFETITFIDRNQQLVGGQAFNGRIFDLYVQLRFAHPRMTIFTWESTNSERWFQLQVREGRLVGQLVNAGRNHEIISDVMVNDRRWHSVYWEVDSHTMRLQVDRRAEKSLSAHFLLPATYTYIVGSRSPGRGTLAGFAGQLRNLHLCGQEVHLGQMVQKLNPVGIQLGEAGYCPPQPSTRDAINGRLDPITLEQAKIPRYFSNNKDGNSLTRRQVSPSSYRRCEHGGECVELYDGYKCNCSRTPFAGERCESEVGMWIPLGSQLSIPWQHPAHAGPPPHCYRLNVHTASANVSLMRARGLFAESTFNLSIDVNGHLNLLTYDGFFHRHNVTFEQGRATTVMNDERAKDIKFCANRTALRMTVNEELAMLLEGNFSFFAEMNVWNFVDQNFTGCISRLRIGNGFPLKNPRSARLSHSEGIKFGSCPYDPLEYHRPTQDEEEAAAGDGDIHISAIVRSQQRLLLITQISAAIGILTALLLALGLCGFVFYVRSRPDGVYKTNENLNIATAALHGRPLHARGSKSAEPLMPSSLSATTNNNKKTTSAQAGRIDQHSILSAYVTTTTTMPTGTAREQKKRKGNKHSKATTSTLPHAAPILRTNGTTAGVKSGIPKHQQQQKPGQMQQYEAAALLYTREYYC